MTSIQTIDANDESKTKESNLPVPLFIRYVYRGEALRSGRLLELGSTLISDTSEHIHSGDRILRALADISLSNVDLRRQKPFYYCTSLEGWMPLAPDSRVVARPGSMGDSARIDVMLEPMQMSTGPSRCPSLTASAMCSAPSDNVARSSSPSAPDGFFAVGIVNSKSQVNVGTLWRSAYQLGASYIFTIGNRNTWEKTSSDTMKTWRHVPAFRYADWDAFCAVCPHATPWVAIEMGGTPLDDFVHPDRAIYLLGAEDHGLPAAIVRACAYSVSLDAVREASYNVAVAGSIVMYDRARKRRQQVPFPGTLDTFR